MKKIYIALASALVLSACTLDLTPITSYNESNVELADDESGNTSQYNTRSDMEGLRNSLYNSWVKDIQEMGLEDWLVYSEATSRTAPTRTSSATGTGISARFPTPTRLSAT